MADDNVQLTFPIYFGNFHGEKNREKLIDKYIYLIRRGSQKYQDMGKTNKEGRLIKGAAQIPLYVGAEYYFYVSDTEINNFHYNILAHGFYSDPVIIKDDGELNLWHGKYFIGNETLNRRPMRVRVYGKGTQKREWPIAGIKKALFLIGGIHRIENAGIAMITLLEEQITKNPFIIPDDTTVFVLNPVHETNNREINGIDPNRDFELRRLPETKAIVALTDFLVQQYGEIRIISGHHYATLSKRNQWRRDPALNPNSNKPLGVVLPLYKHSTGDDMAWECRDDKITGKMINYEIHGLSADYAEVFNRLTDLAIEPVWRKIHEKADSKEPRGYIYPQEFMYYISSKVKEGRKITMIEFEISSVEYDEKKPFPNFKGEIFSQLFTAGNI